MRTETDFKDDKFHQDYMRVFPLEDRKKLLNPFFDELRNEDHRMRSIWDSLPQLQNTFEYFFQSDDNKKRGGQGQRLADYITNMIRELRALG